MNNPKIKVNVTNAKRLRAAIQDPAHEASLPANQAGFIAEAYKEADKTVEPVPNTPEVATPVSDPRYDQLLQQLLALTALPIASTTKIPIDPKGTTKTLAEIFIDLISGRSVMVVDLEMEVAKKATTNKDITEGLINNSPFYSQKTLEEIATMMIESGLVEPGSSIEIVDPLATYLRPTAESIAVAGKFTEMMNNKWPSFAADGIDIFSYSLAQMGTYLQEKGYKPK